MSKTTLFMQRRLRATCDGVKWDESKHKRDNGGKFSSTGGGGGKKEGKGSGGAESVSEAFNKGRDACIVNAFIAATGKKDDPLVNRWKKITSKGRKGEEWEDSDDREYLDVSAEMIDKLPEGVKLKAMKWLHDQYDMDTHHRDLFSEYFG